MTPVTDNCLPRPWRATIIRFRVKYATAMVLSLLAHAALAQQPPATAAPKGDDLDVTMQIIVDPDAKLPDEVVRRIPLPERKSAPSANPNAEPQSKDADKQDKSNAREAKQAASEAGQSAKERAKEAAEQREQARRAAAEERRRNEDNNGNPNRPPDPPGRPPRD